MSTTWTQVEHDGNMTVADKSQDQPLVFIHGAGMLLPEFEQNLAGKTVGAFCKFYYQSWNGYGVRWKKYSITYQESFHDENGK